LAAWALAIVIEVINTNAMMAIFFIMLVLVMRTRYNLKMRLAMTFVNEY
jgi:hypothetical protein